MGKTAPSVADQAPESNVNSYYSRIMARASTGEMDGNSTGGTPWVHGRGSIVNRINLRGVTGLHPDDNGRSQRPFRREDSRLDHVSQSVQAYAPQDLNDGLIYKDKDPYLNYGHIPSLPKNFGAWDQAGPARPELGLRTFIFRKLAGWSGQANEGMHTNIGFSPRTLPGRARMTTGKQYNLTVARYRGQSYSATTQTLGQ